MNTPLASLPPRDPDTGRVHVIIEAPKGSRNKYKYDEKLGVMVLHKVLPLGAAFPFDYGFVPSTRGEDGDPVDVLALTDEPTFPGCLVTVRLLGVLKAKQTEKGKTVRNDRLVGVVETEFNRPAARSLDDLEQTWLGQVEHFFIAYNEAQGRKFRPLARGGPREAARVVEKGERAFRGGGGA
jgi:inorganic pyrophosphatase